MTKVNDNKNAPMVAIPPATQELLASAVAQFCQVLKEMEIHIGQDLDNFHTQFMPNDSLDIFKVTIERVFRAPPTVPTKN